MGTKFSPKDGWGPDSKRGALCITFDNLGEAALLERGMWGDQPVGEHYTAAFVPRLIEALGDVRTTYFIEASNVALYPDAIKSWVAAGHEVALHAWRHEVWESCDPARRRKLLKDCRQAMRSIGVEPVGFRPPGGAIPSEAWREFEDAGLLYCSDLGTSGVEQIGGMLALPFEWRSVDAYMIEGIMAFMRERCGDQSDPYTLTDWRLHLKTVVDQLAEQGGQHTVIFHPDFLALEPKKLEVVCELIDLAKAADLWLAPVCDVACFVAAEKGIEVSVAA